MLAPSSRLIPSTLKRRRGATAQPGYRPHAEHRCRGGGVSAICPTTPVLLQVVLQPIVSSEMQWRTWVARGTYRETQE